MDAAALVGCGEPVSVGAPLDVNVVLIGRWLELVRHSPHPAVPGPDLSVCSGGGQHSLVGGVPADTLDVVGMARQRGGHFQRVSIPQPDGVVRGARAEQLPRAVPGHTPHDLAVPTLQEAARDLTEIPGGLGRRRGGGMGPGARAGARTEAEARARGRGRGRSGARPPPSAAADGGGHPKKKNV